MNLRENIRSGKWRAQFTLGALLVAFSVCLWFWPTDKPAQERWLIGLQRLAVVAAAFVVTAYNLRTRVLDLVLKIEATPSRMDEFSRIARECSYRLTSLILLFTVTSVGLGALTVFAPDSQFTKWLACLSSALLAASLISFIYIVFSFETVERFALDEAERAARRKEADRLFKDESAAEESAASLK